MCGCFDVFSVFECVYARMRIVVSVASSPVFDGSLVGSN